jgi:hypothetical protein
MHAIEAISGPMGDSWIKWFIETSRLARTKSSEAEGVEANIQNLFSFEKNWLASEHPNPFIDVISTDIPSDEDFPSLALTDKLSYVVLYKAGTEFFRKAITAQSWGEGNTIIYTTAIILSNEGNDVISHVGLWAGDDCSLTPASGIELEKHVWVHTKNELESLQFEFTDNKWV